MLYSEEFLKRLDEYREKTTYARIISLDLEENPIEQVEGTVTSGSVNVDGTSAVRRTCSLQMVAQDIKINEYYWGLNTKFKLEIGIENKIDSNYPKIIWFKMGTYVITSFSVSYTTNSANISLQGKDKMCLLNGEVGGVINATTDFGTYDFYDTETGITTNYKLPIKQILWDAVHAYANEPFHNIILNDLDELGLELVEYQYDTPLYLIRVADTDEYKYPIIGHMNVYVGVNTYDIGDSEHIKYDKLIGSMIDDSEIATKFRLERTASDDQAIYYQAAKIEYGQTAGYKTCDLVYAGDLIANIGESVTSVFDKIKAMLGQFEYFYDLDGRFVFQRQKSLVNTVWTPQKKDGDNELYVEALALASNSMYNFKGNILLSSIQNSPNLPNLRNDYTVWGKRKTISGGEIPIHMRYAIDNKPYRYVDMNGEVWTTLTEEEVEEENEEKRQRSIRAEIEEQLANFRKDENLYPESFRETLQDNPWWHIQEWADYYAILSNGEPPGNLHPYHEMQYICGLGNYNDFIKEWPGFRMSQGGGTDEQRAAYTQQQLMTYIDNPKAWTMYGGANVVQIFRFRNSSGDTVKSYNSHGGCVHTYGEWLSACQYVNGCTKGGVTYAPFDRNYPWDLLPMNAAGTARMRGADGFQYKEYLDALGPNSNYEYKLYRIDAYCYNPQIPEALKEDFLSRLEQQYEYVDPYEGHYKYEMDWREIIYRMAIDYRRYNHDDDFEVRLAANNTPLYPRGVTGYEQYYTDLEGFWRQLYYPTFDDEDRKKQLEYQYVLWRDIDNLEEKSNLYVKGVYKPVGQKVKSLATELEESGKSYYRDTTAGKSYYYNENMNYYISLTNGFTFESNYKNKSWPRKGSPSKISKKEFIEYVNAGILYTREMPAINTLYIRYNYPSGTDEIYPYMAIYNYKSSDAPISYADEATDLDGITHYIKVVSADDPQNPTYVPISEKAISLETKLGSYTLSAASATSHGSAQTLLTSRQEIYDDLDTLKLQNEYIPVNNSDLLNIKTKAQADKWKEPGASSYTNLWAYCNGQSLLANGLTTATQQQRFAEVMQLVLQKVEEAEVELNKATNFEYQLFSDYVVETDYKQRNNLGGTPTLNNAYIYDDTNLYCMADITANSTLSKFYFNPSATSSEPKGARRYTYQYDLDTTGKKLPTLRKTSITYYYAFTNFYDENADITHRFWNKDVFNAPESLNFWFDFLTGDGELRQFTTQAVGDRPKAVNENTVKSIYYRDTPKVIFTSAEKFASEEHKTGYNYFIIRDGYDNMFSISSQGISAKNRIDELIYQYSYCTESVTLQAIPIYYLDVNKRIHVYDDESGIDGDYVVQKISFPLQYNGMMSITATKAPENSVTEREE